MQLLPEPPMLPAESAKVAASDHPVLDVIRERWSPRAFADRPVEPEKLRQVLEAARWAPSSYNAQPWRFILATKDDAAAYDTLLHCLSENNRRWARRAPVLMLTLAHTRFEGRDRTNRHAWHDVGLAMGQLVLQATALDLYVHQMAGIRPAEARQRYAIPDDYDVVAGAAIGYLGDPATLPENLQQRETKKRSRRPLRESVFADRFGQSAPLVTETNRS